MKLAFLLTAIALAPLAALPLADAAHQGACWHEYVEGAVWALSQPRPLQAYGAVVGYCNERLKDQVCYVLVGNKECVAS